MFRNKDPELNVWEDIVANLNTMHTDLIVNRLQGKKQNIQQQE